ncbi:MAG: hypothetical protein GY798_34800, partial [Hyphomicrobiales bacterium]|nr:hypothetical protein [Hyphomicrobiales bacterium]
MKAGNCDYGSPEDLPGTIPVFPLPGALLLPRAEMPLNIFEPRYVAMIDSALAGDRVIGMIQTDNTKPSCLLGPCLRRVGCVGRITTLSETGDGRYMVTLTGVARFAVVDELTADLPFRQCRIDTASFSVDFMPEADSAVDRDAVLQTFRAYLSAHRLDADWESVNGATNETLVNALAMMAPFDAVEKQA